MVSTRSRYLHRKLRRAQYLWLTFQALIIGIVACLGAGAIRFFPHYLNEQFMFFTKKVGVPNYADQLILVLLVLMINAFLLLRWTKPQGIGDVMIAGYIKEHSIPRKGLIINTIGSILSLTAGLPVGSVGPSVYFGAGAANQFANRLHKNPNKARTLLACGAAGSIAALFNAPLGGMLFVIEIILHKYNTQYFGLVIISSFSASLLSRWMFGESSIFVIPDYTWNVVSEIPFFILLGLLCGGYALIHIKTLYGFESFWKKLKFPPFVTMLVSVFISWAGIISFPNVKFGGFKGIEDALLGSLPLAQLLFLLIFFLLAHSMVISSGFFGGIFGPVLFGGAMLGGAYGIIVHLFAPEIATYAGLYALLGIAGVVSSTCRAPLTAIVLLLEMTNDYSLVLPMMITSVIAFIMHSTFQDQSIFTAKLFHNRRFRRSIPLS